MNDTEAGLLAAVIETPGDDTPRLIFADWLEEHAGTADECAQCDGHGRRGHCRRCRGHYNTTAKTCILCPGSVLTYKSCEACRGAGRIAEGNAERAEFIRVQCELAKQRETHADTCPCLTCRALRRRGREMLEANRVAWLQGLPLTVGAWSLTEPIRPYAYGARCEYRRGFVEAVTLSADDWLRHADALTAAAPIREVTLTTWPEVIRRPAVGTICEGGYLACFKARLLRVERVERWYGIDYPDRHIVPHLLAAEWPRIVFRLPENPA